MKVKVKVKETETRLPLKVTGDRGATVVEFALVLPIFALLLFSTIEFGNYFFVEDTCSSSPSGREQGWRWWEGNCSNDPKGNPMTRQASIIQTIKDHASIAVNPEALQIKYFPRWRGIHRSR